jgi:carotenoid cleavage dioxygenase-like enzyme
VSGALPTATDLSAEADHALGFTAQSAERDVADLPVQGRIPTWLDGQLIRNCAVAFEQSSWHSKHWFDGLAMLGAFDFAGGRVGFRNRYLRSDEYRAAQNGIAAFASAFRLPRRSLLARLRQPLPPSTDNANISVARIGSAMLALGEGRHQLEFDPASLATLGHHRYDDDLPADLSLIAHPQYDPERRELVSLAVAYRSREILAYRIADGTNRREVVARWTAPRLPYIHSFALTPSKIVLIDHPLRVNPLVLALNLIFGRAAFFDSFVWERDSPTRVVVLDRDGTSLAHFATGEGFFVFHTVRAFEEAGAVVLDVMALDGPPDFAQLNFDRLIVSGPSPWPRLRRFRLDSRGTVQASTVGTVQFDFPTVNEALPAALPHRVVYGVGPRPATPRAFANALFKLDTITGSHRMWSEAGYYLSEAVFVPRGSSAAEDDGVLLTVALIAGEVRSALLVIDAVSLTEIGRAILPLPLPFGFHGRFFPRKRA